MELQVDVPSELSEIFTNEHFGNYPFVNFPQEFEDGRGTIRNIADGSLGDVAIIHSVAKSVRANHIHSHDWHISYMVFGSMEYFWSDDEQGINQKMVRVSAGQMVFTPSNVPHKMVFVENSCFVAVSALSRSQLNYEMDTNRLDSDFFKN